MWKTGYSIFCFAYGGTIYNASGLGLPDFDEQTDNFFEAERDAWKKLTSLKGLNKNLTYTVLSIMKFVA